MELENQGIYRIRHTESNKGYIGSATNFNKRWSRHKRNLKLKIHHAPHLQAAWDKYGEEQFVFEILEKVSNRTKLLEREQYWMDYYKSYDKDFGYNVCAKAGSTLGVPSKNKGVPASEESKNKNRLAHLGKKQSQEQVEAHALACTKPREIRTCICGYGETFEVIVTSTKKYIYHHYINGSSGYSKKIPLETRVCLCGCGKVFEVRKTRKTRFIFGHHTRMESVKEKNRQAHIGKVMSEETRTKMSLSQILRQKK